MTDDLGLVTKKQLDAQVSVLATSSTGNVAKYIKIGTREYALSMDTTITFVLEDDAGHPREDYNLTDSQKEMFASGGSKPLVLIHAYSGTATYILLDTIVRGTNTVDYSGSGEDKATFQVNLAEKTAHYSNKGSVISKSYLDSYIAPSASVDPTQTAKSLKVGNVYWGFGAASGEYLPLAGGTMAGPIILGGERTSPAYITATSALGVATVASPNAFSGTGYALRVADSYVAIGGESLEDCLMYAQPRTEGGKPVLMFLDKDVLTTGYIVNDLTTETSGKVLDAKQGKVLADAIDTKQDKLTTMGSADVPIYIEADGSVQPGNLYSGGTSLTINGASKASSTATIYAPVGGGTAGQVLISGGEGAPTWKSIVNDLDSTATDQPLSASMGKTLADRVESLSTIGRFLSIWNAATGKPVDEPPTSPYSYKTGDYYIVGTVAASGGTNYKPDGAQYIHGSASTVAETANVKTGDTYYYTTTGWQLNATVAQEVSFRALTGDVADNAKLVAEFAKYLPLTGGKVSGILTLGTGTSYITTDGTELALTSKSGISGTKVGLTDTAVTIGATGAVLGVDATNKKLTWNTSEILSKANVVNSLTQGGTDVPLSAEQGKVLNALKLDLTGGRVTGNIVLAGGTDAMITTDGEYLMLMSPGAAGAPAGVLGLADGEVTLGTTEASITIQTGESESRFAYNGNEVLTAAHIVDDLTTGGTDKALSAEQGKILASKVPLITVIPQNTATEIDAPRYGGVIIAGGNLVAIGSNLSSSGKFWANGQLFTSGDSFSISFVQSDGSTGVITITVTVVSTTKYSITADLNIIFMG